MQRRFFVRLTLCLAIAIVGATGLYARTFDVVAYNVENLFDIDGKAIFDDYGPATYGPEQLLTKVRNIARVLHRFNNGRGPDIILFEEFEADLTPSTANPIPYGEILHRYAGESLADMLRAPVKPEVADLPAQVFLLKAIAEAGMDTYHVAVGAAAPGPDPLNPDIAHNNVIFSRFPITSEHTWFTAGARGILEVTVSVDGDPLILLDNHWKSGASDPKTEPIRIGNAEALRQRLDELLNENPSADIVVAGDFNSMYNQSRRYPFMPKTGMNSVLSPGGDEAAMEKSNGPILYNLWYELPATQRGSDVYHNEWGTLMEMMITRGLYDDNGIQYVDNSFRVARFPGLNADPVSGGPIRWSSEGHGSGFSDHLPIEATFTTVATHDTAHFVTLNHPGVEDVGPLVVNRLWTVDKAVVLDPSKADSFQPGKNDERMFKLTARVLRGPSPVVEYGGKTYELWVPDRNLRAQISGAIKPGEEIQFYGVLGRYKGAWQFEIVEPDWWLGPAAPPAVH